MAKRFTTEEVLEFLGCDDDFGLSDSESSEKEDGYIHVYHGLLVLGNKDFDCPVGVASNEAEVTFGSSLELVSSDEAVSQDSDDAMEQENSLGR